MKNKSQTLKLINPTSKPFVAITSTLLSPNHLQRQNQIQTNSITHYQHNHHDNDNYNDNLNYNYHHHQDQDKFNSAHHSKDHIIDLSPSIKFHQSSKYHVPSTPSIQPSPAFSRLAPLSPQDLSSNLNSIPPHYTLHWRHFSERRPLLAFSISLLIVLLSSALLLAALVWSLLPPLDPKDWPILRIPTSFHALKKLNTLLQLYKTENYYRVLSSFVFIYLFLQAFSLPGSMYLSILAGAMFGVQVALPLVSLCVGTGAMLSYLMSLNLASGLVIHSTCLRTRLDDWKIKLSSKTNKFDLFSYLVVIRISPLPPHWVVNLLAPHVGIPLALFWLTTCIGILPVTLIHTQLGTTLDQMVGPEDLSFLTTKNLVGLSLVALGVMIPVLIRWYLRKDLQDLCHHHPTNTLESRSFPTRSIGLRLESNDSIDQQGLTITTPRRTNHRLRNLTCQPFENLLNSSTTSRSSFSSLNKLTSMDSTDTLLLSSHQQQTLSPSSFLKSSQSPFHQPLSLFSESTGRKSNSHVINSHIIEEDDDDDDDDNEEDDDKALLLKTKNNSRIQQHAHHPFNRIELDDDDSIDHSIEEIKFNRAANRSSTLSSCIIPRHQSDNQQQPLVDT